MSEASIRRFWFAYRIQLPAHAPGDRIELWIPRPVRTEFQSIEEEIIDARCEVLEASDATFGNRGAYLTPSPEVQSIEFRYRIERRARHSIPETDISGEDFADGELERPELGPLLAPNLNVPTDGFIAYQARSIASPSEPPTERARLLFDHLIDTLDYDWGGCTPARLAELGNLRKACDLRLGTCTEFHGLYVGYLRALEVPAQFCFGFNIPSDAKSGNVRGYHCWSEVFLPRAGWFPVDVSEAWKHPEIRDFYFGGLDCNRVQFHVGRDLELKPPQRGPPVDKWIFGHAERNGEPFPLDVSFRFEDVAD